MPNGRPSKYDPKYDEQARKLCLLGLTSAELAEYFEVHIDTIYAWMNTFPSFSEAVKSGKENADADVATKLYNRAMGAEWIEEEAIKVRDEHGNVHVEVVEVRRAAPPDTTAAIFWLKNRRSKMWRDRAPEDENGAAAVQIVISGGLPDRVRLGVKKEDGEE